MTDNERKLLVTVSRVLAKLPSAAVSRRQILSLVRKVEEAEVARKAREAEQEERDREAYNRCCGY